MSGPSTSSGGVCRRGIYDNMKTAVSMVFVGKERAYNRRFLELCSHHLVEPVACTPGAGWEKGQVERQVGDVRGRLFVPIPRGRSYAEINAWLMDRCIEDAKKRPHPTIEGKTVWQVFEEERPFLMAYRSPFDGFHATEVAVSKTCLVRFDNNHYSDAARAVGRPVDCGPTPIGSSSARTTRPSPGIPGASGAARSPTIRGTTCRS